MSDFVAPEGESQSEHVHFQQNPKPCTECDGMPSQTNVSHGAYAVGWSCETWNPICLAVTTPVSGHSALFAEWFILPLAFALSIQLVFGPRSRHT